MHRSYYLFTHKCYCSIVVDHFGYFPSLISQFDEIAFSVMGQTTIWISFSISQNNYHGYPIRAMWPKSRAANQRSDLVLRTRNIENVAVIRHWPNDVSIYTWRVTKLELAIIDVNVKETKERFMRERNSNCECRAGVTSISSAERRGHNLSNILKIIVYFPKYH